MRPPAECPGTCDVAALTGAYILNTHQYVETVYQMWKDGELKDGNAKGTAFVTARVADGAAEVRDLVTYAWNASGQDGRWVPGRRRGRRRSRQGGRRLRPALRKALNRVPKPPAPLQFGHPEPGVKYRDRPAVFGIAERNGQIALIQVTREGAEPFYDLPGGAIEPGESESRALAREFSEETGLVIKGGEGPGPRRPYMVKSDGEPVNNRSTLMTATIEGYDPGTKIEEDHKLAWLTPDEALRVMRLDSQAWAIVCWLRKREQQAKGQAA